MKQNIDGLLFHIVEFKPGPSPRFHRGERAVYRKNIDDEQGFETVVLDRTDSEPFEYKVFDVPGWINEWQLSHS